MKPQSLFVSLMPLLKNRKGHDCVYHECVKEVVDTHQMDYQGYISSECALTDIPSSWKKWFAPLAQSSLWQQLKQRYLDYARLFRTLPQETPRTFFIESFTSRDFQTLFIAILFHSKPTDRFCFLFRYSLPDNRRHHVHLLIKILHRKLRSRLVPLTDSEKLRKQFQERSLPAPFVLPIPHTRHVPKQEKSEKLRCWWPGLPRETKGWEEIRRLTRLHDPAAQEFTLVAATASQLMPASSSLAVELIQDQLSEEEYTQKLAECQIVLLPYDPHQYGVSTSGIFVEAVVAHKLPIVKAGSWLADELLRFDLPELIVEWNRSDFFTHVLSLFHDEKIKTKLAAMQQAYVRYHNQESFHQTLSELL